MAFEDRRKMPCPFTHTCHCSSSFSRTTGPQGTVRGSRIFMAIFLLLMHLCSQSINSNIPMTPSCSFLLSPSDYIHDVNNHTSCIVTFHAWFYVNDMALNPYKFETILLSAHQWAFVCSNLVTIIFAGCQFLWQTR